jgi:hypothetical protein
MIKISNKDAKLIMDYFIMTSDQPCPDEHFHAYENLRKKLEKINHICIVKIKNQDLK